MLIEAFIPKTPVEGLDEGILHELAGGDAMPLDASCFDPAQNGVARQFSAVVGDDHCRPAVQFAKPIEFADGLCFEHVVVARIYLTQFKQDYPAMNGIYRSYFPPDRLPARTSVCVTGLAYDALVEIDLVRRRP